MLAFAADAGAFAALGGQDAGVAGVGVAPAQVVLQPPAQDALVGVKNSSTLACPAQARIAGVLFADRLSRMTNRR